MGCEKLEREKGRGKGLLVPGEAPTSWRGGGKELGASEKLPAGMERSQGVEQLQGCRRWGL